MKFKLDENFGTRTRTIFESHGSDVHTVRDERLQGCSDQHLFEVCVSEGYCLVTFDLDFSDVTRFRVKETSGVAIIRVPQNPNSSIRA